MAEFIAFNKDVEVNKQTVMSVANSMEKGREARLNILKENGINVEEQDWFALQSYLDAFKDIAQKVGDMNVFLIGKAIVDNANFPPIKDLEQALRSLDVAYHMNHRVDGRSMYDPIRNKVRDGIGSYNLTEYDANNKKAIMVCDNPYPSKFDEGIITCLIRRFKPAGSYPTVKLDTSKETRLKGADSCTYIITW